MPLLTECVTILVSHPKDPNMLKDLNYFIQKRKIVSVNESLTYTQDNCEILNYKSGGLV